jgi:hypothetical protein
MSSSSSTYSGSYYSSDDDDEVSYEPLVGPPSRIMYAKPFTCIIHNLPYTEDGHGKAILSYSLDWLIGLIRLAGLNLVQNIYPDNDAHDGFGRYALIEFGGGEDRECFRQARKLERAFYNNDSSRLWFDHDDQRVGPYLWVANESDRRLLIRIMHRQGRIAEQWTVPSVWENDYVDWAEGERDIYGEIVSEFHRMG